MFGSIKRFLSKIGVKLGIIERKRHYVAGYGSMTAVETTVPGRTTRKLVSVADGFATGLMIGAGALLVIPLAILVLPHIVAVATQTVIVLAWAVLILGCWKVLNA